jgi:hypothetical protein
VTDSLVKPPDADVRRLPGLRAGDLPAADAPEPSECRSSCRNLAYTDRDVSAAHHRLARLRQAAASPLTPRPLRDRAAGQAARLQAVIDRHQATRSSNGEEPIDEPPAT